MASSKINVLGKSGAHKVMLLAAVAFNLRKYMKFKPTKTISIAMALEKERQQPFSSSFFEVLLLSRLQVEKWRWSFNH